MTTLATSDGTERRVARAAVGTAIVLVALLGIENRAVKVLVLLVGAEVMLSGKGKPGNDTGSAATHREPVDVTAGR